MKKFFISYLSIFIPAISFCLAQQNTLKTPSSSQQEWANAGIGVLIHFDLVVFEPSYNFRADWNDHPSLSVFDPKELDTNQWIRAAKAAGAKYAVLVANGLHGTFHPKQSLSRRERGDVVKAVSDACKKYGLKFGIYLSPWDRNRADYGTPSYIEYYRNQLKELFTTYGPVFEMWFDGANGGNGYYGGANEKRKIDGSTYYDWPGTLELVRSMNPEVLFFSDGGPDLRWMGKQYLSLLLSSSS